MRHPVQHAGEVFDEVEDHVAASRHEYVASCKSATLTSEIQHPVDNPASILLHVKLASVKPTGRTNLRIVNSHAVDPSAAPRLLNAIDSAWPS
ncbi:MAG: hypothetical protein DWQ34_16785 [Planctomycetota bacterium]|nr:MAG: hypothetical protein DWQ34_16785 [Planctomycetota bacterium]